ncbi:unnamed protein product [Pleuronectes platessa]|uniref:Uncharacterized protein n=1 Tax=Pleuronectes platessa TaxID=8262 RepID=A0A9N7VEU3_PLEPL|nr:unnamed protein product [Pleuronectes platessa]
MPLDCGRKPEFPEETHTGTGRAYLQKDYGQTWIQTRSLRAPKVLAFITICQSVVEQMLDSEYLFSKNSGSEWLELTLRHRQRIHFERGTQNVEATPDRRVNPYRPGAWLFTTDTEATLNRRAALIISPVDPVDRCTALCRSHRRLKQHAAPRLPRGASASGVTGTKF